MEKENNKVNRNVTRKKRVKKRKDKRKKFSIKLFLGFIIFQLIFGATTSLFILFYGPFETARSIFVGTAMGSMHYKWLATSFLSEEKIAEITGSNEVDTSNNYSSGIDTSTVKITKLNDKGIEYKKFEAPDGNYVGHVLIINDPTRVKIGYTSTLNEENPVGEETSTIAENNDAVAAINGGAFSDEVDTAEWTANGGSPSGVIITNGEVVYDDLAGAPSYVTAITKDGHLFGGYYTTEQLMEMNTSEAVSFKAPIILNGEKLSLKGRDDADGIVSRTLIGQLKTGEIVFLVLDSKNNNKLAATLYEAQDVMYEQLGCETAIPLDGGKSTTMYYKGEVVNNPTYVYGERPIPTAIIVK